MQFRIILGLGALPSLVVMMLCLAQEDSAEFIEARRRQRQASDSPLRVALRHPEHWRKLVGTGLTWLLFDCVYFGTTLNQPVILESVFGRADGAWDTSVQSIVAASFGLPGVLLAIGNLRCWGSKRLQHWGFVSNAVTAAAFAGFSALAPENKVANFSVFCLLVTSLNWGPNVSTYVLPTETFPAAVRSSFFGLSAAMGKAGALIGGAAFGPIASSGTNGLAIVLLLCSALSVTGAAVTIWHIEPYGKPLCG